MWSIAAEKAVTFSPCSSGLCCSIFPWVHENKSEYLLCSVFFCIMYWRLQQAHRRPPRFCCTVTDLCYSLACFGSFMLLCITMPWLFITFTVELLSCWCSLEAKSLLNVYYPHNVAYMLFTNFIVTNYLSLSVCIIHAHTLICSYFICRNHTYLGVESN